MNKVKLNTATAGAPAGAELEVIERNTNSMVLRTDDGRHIVVPLSHIDEIPESPKPLPELKAVVIEAPDYTGHPDRLPAEVVTGSYGSEGSDPDSESQQPPFAETADAQPLWDEKANVFVNADGTIAQPQTDDERKRLGLPSVEEEFHAQTPEDQANAHLTGNETEEGLKARGFTLEPVGEDHPVAQDPQPEEEPVKEDTGTQPLGFEDETQVPEEPKPAKKKNKKGGKK